MCLLVLPQGVASADQNIALGARYRLSTEADTRDTFGDHGGPERWPGVNRWYRGELTDGKFASESSSDPAWAYIHAGDPMVVTIDLGGLATVRELRLHGLAGGRYGIAVPKFFEVRVTSDTKPPMPYGRAVTTFESDECSWRLAGHLTFDEPQDGKSLRLSTVSIPLPSVKARQVQIEMAYGPDANVASGTYAAISEVEVIGDPPRAREPAPDPVQSASLADGSARPFPIEFHPNRKATDLSSFLWGVHANLSDAPNGTRLVLADIIKDRPAGFRAEGTRLLKSLGLRALRFYDAYWVNFRSSIEAYSVCDALMKRDWPVPATDEGYRYPYYPEIIDYCAQNDIACVMVLDTIYLDPATKKVYKTCDVVDDVDGVLQKAAERNAAPIARYYHQRGYKTRLILEIGNESIGYGADRPNPTAAQYTRLIEAFAGVIKREAPEAEVAIYEWPDAGIYERVKHIGKLIDHTVIHPYGYWLAPAALHGCFVRNTVRELDKAGLTHVKVLMTEYGGFLLSKEARTYSEGLRQAVSEMSMSLDPRVSGIFEHSLFLTAKAVHSDGKLWSMSPSYGEKERRPDINPELGPRFATLTGGLVSKLMSPALDGKLIAYWPGINSPCAGFATRRATSTTVVLVNPTEKPIPLRWPEGFRARKVSTLTSSAERMGLDMREPWQIDRKAVSSNPPELSAKSIVVVED